MTKTEKLLLWQQRLSENESAFVSEYEKMDEREDIYLGSKDYKRSLVSNDKSGSNVHIRNIVSELIETQVSSDLPGPKVTAKRACDEEKAKLIENMLRNEMDRLPLECINDIMERTVLIQGGGAFFLEWDTAPSAGDFGNISITPVHPKQLIVQNGVYSDISDMDYFILKLPQTRENIKRKYGIELEDEEGNSEDTDETATQYVAYYKNDDGTVGMFSWVGDTVICDYENYQSRNYRICNDCGEILPSADNKNLDGRCPFCGGKNFENVNSQSEEKWVLDPDGTYKKVRIPFYEPKAFPIVLQKNVSVFGKLYGESDVDKISDQQNTANRIETKIIDKLLKSGSYITLPDEASIRFDSEDMKVIRPGSAANKNLIDVFDLQGNIEQDLVYLNQVYEEARQIIGITDSFQGRNDTTALSGRAKEFSASQSVGRLMSKRVMKEAAYAKLFELIFKFKLAFEDEKRYVVSRDDKGNSKYDVFDRYDFLEQDENGNYYWNDAFLFSCDTSSALAANREKMWQETRMNLQSGAFGDPSDIDTLILFWSKMDALHYPGASETKRYLEKRLFENINGPGEAEIENPANENGISAGEA